MSGPKEVIPSGAAMPSQTSDTSIPGVLLRLLEASASDENIAEVGRSDLGRNLDGSIREILTRLPGEPKIAVARQGDEVVVTIINDDRPFLLDSVLGEINARSATVALVLHPILEIERNARGEIVAAPLFASRTSMRANKESVIILVLRGMEKADLSDLKSALLSVLEDVRLATSDWHLMLERIADAEKRLIGNSSASGADARSEARQLIKWLTDRNFTFLGLRQYRIESSGKSTDEASAIAIPGTSLGVLRPEDLAVLSGHDGARERALLRAASGDSLMVVAKSNIDGRVHRRTILDYIGIPDLDVAGNIIGELRIVGLFTSQSYQVQPADIPVVRQKAAAVLAAAGAPEESHDGKAMRHILATLPRDELFQIELTELQRWTHAILDLELRPRVRVLSRKDRFGRFFSFLVFAPRDRWTTMVRRQIAEQLQEAAGGRVTSFTPYFTEGPLVRAHFVIAVGNARAAALDEKALEGSITEICRTWEDEFVSGTTFDDAMLDRYATAFPPAYRNAVSPRDARIDLAFIEQLSDATPVRLNLMTHEANRARVRAKVFRRGEPLRLSDRVPLLENMGFSVIDESTYVITPRLPYGHGQVTLHVMELETSNRAPLNGDNDDARIESAFDAIFRGSVENDTFNQLVMVAGATWREAAILRAYGSFLRQLDVPFGIRLIADTCVRHAGITRDLLELFHLRLNPSRQPDAAEIRASAAAAITARIDGALASVPSLDEDRILRNLLNLILATVRTNVFCDHPESGPLTLAFKFDSKAIDASPSPRPYREIWVSSPQVDGVHLRFGPVARGGLRWSDRAQDFRTEVLGLVRAQVVKNAVIVPTGSKGGFFPKQLPRSGSREAIQAEGLAAYTTFVSALVDLTDNIDGTSIVPPKDVVRLDGDDPYLVVAADKGTATFSDTANAISARNGFWLGDAFASGGSVGYDHKKMGITARGAWESVTRHFREMNKDIQVEPFDVAGVGDMSGDVFGNGMLLSPAIRLIAAFDHRDIFVDPNPDAAMSFAERKRLFQLPRSSWQDYDRSKLSRGGVIASRAAKSVDLSPEIRTRLGIDAVAVSPNELMRAILKCNVDLLWLGGIGTYARANSETNEQVGDRSNDAIRVTGVELGAKVIGEGANLGLTQKARIEFAQAGGRLNTDFIDNSAGVNSSDIEVNFKIALQPATLAGSITPEDRKAFLASLTPDVAAACVRNNYRQSLAISLTQKMQFAATEDVVALAQFLERRGALNRRLESFPADEDVLKRIRAGQGLTRPELSVLMSFAKLELTEDIVASGIPDLKHAQSYADDYFPLLLREKFGEGIAHHRLRREIIATALANAILNRGGAAFVAGLASSTGKPVVEIVLAYLIADTLLGAEAMFSRLDELDNHLPGDAQLHLYQSVTLQLSNVTRAILRRGVTLETFANVLARQRENVAAFRSAQGTLGPMSTPEESAHALKGFADLGASEKLANDLAAFSSVVHSLDVADLARSNRATVSAASVAYFEAGALLALPAIEQQVALIKSGDEYDRKVVNQAVMILSSARDRLACRVLASGTPAKGLFEAIALQRVQQATVALNAAPTLTPSRLLVHALDMQSEIAAITGNAVVPA